MSSPPLRGRFPVPVGSDCPPSSCFPAVAICWNAWLIGLIPSLIHAGRVRCRPLLARVILSCRAAPATLREPVTAHLLSMAKDKSTNSYHQEKTELVLIYREEGAKIIFSSTQQRAVLTSGYILRPAVIDLQALYPIK